LAPASQQFARDRRHLIGDAVGLEPGAEVEARRVQVALGQAKIGNLRKGPRVSGNRNQRAVCDARIGALIAGAQHYVGSVSLNLPDSIPARLADEGATSVVSARNGDRA
jgi:hypothetical protein